MCLIEPFVNGKHRVEAALAVKSSNPSRDSRASLLLKSLNIDTGINKPAPRHISIFLLCLCIAIPAYAHDEQQSYNRVHLSAAAETEVENDVLEGHLYFQREGDDPGTLAAEVNQTIEWAASQAREYPEIEFRTMDYRTSPVYKNQTLVGWRVRQSLGLKSADSPRLGGLIAKLQTRLAVQSVSYRLSRQRRQDVEGKLVIEAIDSFKQRAELIAKRLGHTKYRLVSLSVHTGGNTPHPVSFRSAEALLSQAAVSPPTLEPGSSEVQIRVDGTVELQVE